jgi:hypothetical protein
VNTSKRGNARRGSVGIPRVTPSLSKRTFRVLESLEPRHSAGVVGSPASIRVVRNGKRDWGRREASPATGKGKPLKVEAQGRYPHETGRKGLWAEQSVKSLRKVEDAAQSGQVSPA